MKRRNAQQITEFMLAAPLLVAFFVVLTEFAYTFNANLVLSNAVKSSVGSYLKTISSDATAEDYETAVRNYVLNDMQRNRMQNLDSLQTELISIGDYPAVVSGYVYRPGFGFAFMPALRQIDMAAISIFPFKNQDLSGYAGGLSTEELNLIEPEEAAPDGGGATGAAAGGGA